MPVISTLPREATLRRWVPPHGIDGNSPIAMVRLISGFPRIWTERSSSIAQASNSGKPAANPLHGRFITAKFYAAFTWIVVSANCADVGKRNGHHTGDQMSCGVQSSILCAMFLINGDRNGVTNNEAVN